MEINNSIYDCVYELYFPKGVFTQLINLCNYQLIDGNYRKAFTKNNLFNNPEVVELFNTIDFEFYCILKQPTSHIVLNILTDLSSRVDFRKLDCNTVEKVEGGELNNKVQMTEEFKDFYSDYTYSNKDLDLILKCYTELQDKLFTGKLEAVKPISRRMRTITEVFKSKKSTLIEPLFMFKALTKSIPVTADATILDQDSKVLVYLEDSSSSMIKNNGFRVSRAIQKVLLESKNPVEYYRYSSKGIEYKQLNTSSEKVNAFSKEQTYYSGDCNYTEILDEILIKYKTSQVIIVTDAQDNVPLVVNSNASINCIDVSNTTNRRWKTLCKSTHGKYLKL